MQRFLLSFSIFLLSLSLKAQDTTKVDIGSPYRSIWTHLFYLQDDSYNDSIASLPFEPETRGAEKARDLAIKLKQVFDGNGIYIYLDEVPKNENYYDSAFNKHKYLLTKEFPDIYLLKRDHTDDWIFADASVVAIEEAHQATFRFGTGALLKYLPKLGSKKVFGLYMFQYLAILLLVLLSAVIYKIFTYVSEHVIRSVLISSGFGQTSHELLLPIAKPSSVFIIVLLLTLLVPVLQLPPSYSQYLIMGLKIMVPLMGTIIIYQFVNVLAIYLAKLAEKTESTLDDQMVPLLRKTFKTFVVIVGSLFILDNLNVPILPLLTGLSIGGLAFALAAQDSIKNFFGSLMIFIDKPFQIGDWVSSGDIDGTVEEVGFRSTRIRTFRNSLMYIPNSKLADGVIDNHGLRKQRRFFTKIAVAYSTPPALLETFVEGLKKIVENHPSTMKDNYHVYFNELGASSMEIMFYIFFKVPTWGDELKARHEILMEIIKLAQSLGVHFAFPTQTLHVENFPGQLSNTPRYLNETEMKEEMDRHFAKE